MKSSSVSECCGAEVSLYWGPDGNESFTICKCDKCGNECDRVPPQSGKLDIVQRITQRELGSGKEWKHGVGGNITLGYTKILTESDKTKKEILDKLIELAEQRGYERGISEGSGKTLL